MYVNCRAISSITFTHFTDNITAEKQLPEKTEKLSQKNKRTRKINCKRWKSRV